MWLPQFYQAASHSILRDNGDPEKFKTPQFAKIPEWHLLSQSPTN